MRATSATWRVSCRIADPTIAVVTNVGVAHMEVFGSWAAIVEASAEPVDALAPEDLAILNADDADRRRRSRRAPVPGCASFGRGAEADVRADDVRLDRDGCASFALLADGRSGAASRCPSRVSTWCTTRSRPRRSGSSWACRSTRAPRRCRARTDHALAHGDDRDPVGVRVVNDAYNANPESVAAALKTARWMAAEGRLIAVLGQMAELGPIADDEHERIGELAARLRVDRLITIGPEAKAIAVAGVREGVEPENVADYDDADAALADVLAVARGRRRRAGQGLAGGRARAAGRRLVEALS